MSVSESNGLRTAFPLEDLSYAWMGIGWIPASQQDEAEPGAARGVASLGAVGSNPAIPTNKNGLDRNRGRAHVVSDCIEIASPGHEHNSSRRDGERFAKLGPLIADRNPIELATLHRLAVRQHSSWSRLRHARRGPLPAAGGGALPHDRKR